MGFKGYCTGVFFGIDDCCGLSNLSCLTGINKRIVMNSYRG